MAITAYKVTASRSAGDLTAAVTAAIGGGWQPVGNAFIGPDGLYCQTLIQGAQILVGATGPTGATGATGPTGPTGP